MPSSGSGELKPPYGPWTTFANFISGLNGSVIPPVVDATLISNLSGSAQSQLRGALRFLRLVEGKDDRVTDHLRTLVDASSDPNTWKDELKRLFPGSYSEILDGVDLKAGTRGQLEAAFRERGQVSGSVNEKAVRFLLAAMDNAGQEVSPHFATSNRSKAREGSTPRKSTRRSRAQRPTDASDEKRAPLPPGTERVTCSIPGGRTVEMTLPSGLTDEEENFLLLYLKGYFELGRQKE